MVIAGAAVVKKALAEMKRASEKLFHGEVTLSKKDCWLIGAILVLTGIAIGFINAPLTHGVNISFLSNNGSNNGNNNGNNSEYGTDDAQDELKEKELCKSKKKKSCNRETKGAKC